MQSVSKGLYLLASEAGYALQGISSHLHERGNGLIDEDHDESITAMSQDEV